MNGGYILFDFIKMGINWDYTLDDFSTPNLYNKLKNAFESGKLPIIACKVIDTDTTYTYNGVSGAIVYDDEDLVITLEDNNKLKAWNLIVTKDDVSSVSDKY